MPPALSAVDDPAAPSAPPRSHSAAAGRSGWGPTPVRPAGCRAAVALLALGLIGVLALALAGGLARHGGRPGGPLLALFALVPLGLAGSLALFRIALTGRPTSRATCLLVYLGCGALIAATGPFAVAAMIDLTTG